MTVTIPETTAETIVSCIEALSKKEGDIEYLTNYTGYSQQYIKRAINMGEQLNIFNTNNRTIRLTSNSSTLIKKIDGNYFVIFQSALFAFKPFILLVDFIINGETTNNAIRKIKAIYDINSSEKIILKTFTNFLKSCGISPLSQDILKSHFTQRKEQYKHINKIINQLHNTIESELFISEKLGINCYNFIVDSERKLLVNSLLKVHKQPENAIDDASGAFESILRRIAKEQNIDLEKSNGIDQLGQVLASKENKIILAEHRNMCAFIGGVFRNPAVHKVQKSTLNHWKIESDSSIEIILLIMTCIRSIYSYVYENEKLVL